MKKKILLHQISEHVLLLTSSSWWLSWHFWGMFGSQMHAKPITVAKCLLTESTSKLVDSGMLNAMLAQTRVAAEWTTAKLALVTVDASVALHVTVPAGARRENMSAYCTCELPGLLVIVRIILQTGNGKILWRAGYFVIVWQWIWKGLLVFKWHYLLVFIVNSSMRCRYYQPGCTVF